MPTDFLTLLRRDHDDLQKELTSLLDPIATVAQLRCSLDGVRLGLTAHAEAEDIVLGRYDMIPALELVIAQVRAGHLAQERALSSLVSTRPGTRVWRERAFQLRELIAQHDKHEGQSLLPMLHQHVPDSDYGTLAGAYATERLRQLAMMQPSAPVFANFTLAEAHA